MEVGEGRSEQAHLRRGMGEVKILRDWRRGSSRQDQFSRQRECMLVGAVKHKRTRIGDEARIETRGDLRSDRGAALAGKAIDEFGGGAGLGIDPVHVREGATADVVVDIDEELAFEALKAGAL